ncbi:MAG: ABC transporter ATP-binding protein/permease [Planctomycetes bacterium]|nr:ABC transporter ATP-binding protein/permease [Planctomycetota bacterium]
MVPPAPGDDRPPPPRGADNSRRRYADFLHRWRTAPDTIDAKDKPSEPTAEPEPAPGARATARQRYRQWLWPRRRAIASMLLLGIVGIAIDLIWPVVSCHLFDNVILDGTRAPADRQHELVLWSAIMLGIYLFGSLLGYVRTMQSTRLFAHLAFDLRRHLYGRILRLPLDEVYALKTGGVISRLSSDVDSTTGLLQNALLSPVLAGLRLVATVVVMFWLDWRLALAAIVVMPPVMLVHARFIGRVRPIWRSIGADRQEVDARVGEAVSGLRIVRGFARERAETRQFTVGHHAVIKKQVLSARTHGAVNLVWSLLMPMATLAVVAYGGWLVIDGTSTIGTVVALQAYLWRLLEPVMQIANSISETQRGLAAMERVFELAAKPAEKPDRPGARPAAADFRVLRFEGVSFGYGNGPLVLHELDLEVPRGATVALVGPSGAGKTTFSDLVARFHDPTQGRITLDGTDLRDLQLASYRALLGLVQQETFLFDGSVRDNIRYPRRSASDAEVEAAARRANADEFVQRLPQGYDTKIGERGVKLSGGQRQRLAIARALLADPAILILDEATSNLDTESERLIQESLTGLLRGRTTFVIAHRLSTIASADLIAVFDGGRIVERGTHRELLALGGRYRRMVELQAQGVVDPWQQDRSTA